MSTNMNNQSLEKCFNCIFITEDKFFGKDFCINCFYLPKQKQGEESKQAEALGMLYQAKQHIIDNMQALTNKMDPSGLIQKMYSDLYQKCELKIIEIHNSI